MKLPYQLVEFRCYYVTLQNATCTDVAMHCFDDHQLESKRKLDRQRQHIKIKWIQFISAFFPAELTMITKFYGILMCIWYSTPKKTASSFDWSLVKIELLANGFEQYFQFTIKYGIQNHSLHISSGNL